jgi:hypothetical protein
MWLNLSAEQGDSAARKFRDEVAEKMTSAQIAEAKRLTTEWKPKGKIIAPAGLDEGKTVYDKGDSTNAYFEMRAGAEEGNTSAQFSLGKTYAQGEGLSQDYAEAAKWYSEAAKRGYADAQVNLGSFYLTGNAGPKNYVEAVRWFRKAAEQGDAGGQFMLGLRYFYGEGVPQDYILAFMWLNLAVVQRPDLAKARDIVADKMTPSQIAEAQRLASVRPKTPVFHVHV